MGDQIINVTDDSFDEVVLGDEGVVLVDFWAPWCGPCKMLAPVLDEVASLYAGQAKICKCDIDSNPQTPVKYAIRSIPTIIIFKNKEAVFTHSGMLSKKQIQEAIDKVL